MTLTRLARPDVLRQSYLARFDQCALSLKLDLQSPGRQPSDLAARGTLFHRWVARALGMMREQGENQLPIDVGLELMRTVCDQLDVPAEDVVHVPMREQEWLRVAAVRWCERGVTNVHRTVAIEERLTAKIPVRNGNGSQYEREISGKPDVLVADPPDGMLVLDWKTGYKPPAKRMQPSEERPMEAEDRLSEEGYAQQRIYGTLVLLNFPQVQRVTLREFYVLFGEYREATIVRWNLERYLDVIGSTIAQIDAAFADGARSKRWIPTDGEHCGLCPNPLRCPIRNWKRIPRDDDDVRRIAREWHVSAERRKRLDPLLKGWVNAHGPINIQHDKGERRLGWVRNKTGEGRSFRMYEPNGEES